MKIIGKVLIISVLVIVLASCISFQPKSTESSLPTSTAQTFPISEGMKYINGTSLYYKSIGTGDPIFFLHGSSGSHRYFLPFMEELADSYQLVFYDQRGTGLSDGQLDMSAITIDQFLEDLEALRVALGFEKISLMGHSWGAIIAISYAIKHPAHLDRLILVDSIPVDNEFLLQLNETLRQRIQRLSPEAQQKISTCTQSSKKLSPEALAECNAINAMLRFYDPEKALTFDSAIDEKTAKNSDIIQSLIKTDFNRTRLDMDAKLPTVSLPTLLLHGDFDPIPIASSEYIQQHIPTSQFVIISESGHFPFVEQPEQFFTAIRAFLQR